MSKIKLTGDSSGYVEISAPSVAGNNTLELPASGSKIVVSDGSDNINVAGIATIGNGLNVTGKQLIKQNNNAEGGALYLSNSNTGSSAYSVIRFTDNDTIDGNGNAYIHYFNENWTSNGYWDAKSLASGTVDGNINFFVGGNNNFKVWTNTTQRFAVDGSGRVTMPYQPVFYAYQTGGQAASSTGIFDSTQWNATLINVGNHFNTSNGRFTAPIAGKYVFYGKGLVRWQSSAGSIETTLYKNGSNVVTRGLAYDYMVAANDHANQFFMVYLDLAAGDYIQYGIQALTAGTNLYYGENLGSFSGRLIG